MNGPDPDVLKQLHADMPGMIHDLENQKQLKGQKSAKLARPSKICACCGKGFAHKLVQLRDLPDLEPCKACDDLLKQGWICFISDNRFSFVKTDLPDVIAWAGKIIRIPPDQMDRIELRFKAKVLTKNGKPNE